MDTHLIQSLLHEASTLASSNSDLNTADQTRSTLLRLCQQATAQLTQPDEHVGHLAHSGGRMLCVRIADDLDLFRLLGEKARTAGELAEITGAEEGLVRRVLRMLRVMGFVEEKGGGGVFGVTAAGRQMRMGCVRAGVKLKYAFPVLLLRG